MELEGTLVVERSPTRRWVSVVAVVVPVVLFVVLAAWFIRAFVAPPMVTIPSPTAFASAPPAPPSRGESPAPERPMQAQVALPAEPAQASAQAETAALTLPMIASLAAAPSALTLGTASAAFADPATDRSTAMTPDTGTPVAAAAEAGEPIAGSVPLPRSKPEVSVVAVAARVPLPRPRPTDENPAPEIVPVDRHAID
jgi:hypothetical protein